jgi:type III secretion protein L
MTLWAIHLNPRLSLVSDDLVLPPEQVQSFDEAHQLAAHLAQLRGAETARILQAEQAARDAGYAAGLKQGQLLAQAQLQEQGARELTKAVLRLNAQAQQEQVALQETVVSLALLVVRRIAAGLAREEVLAHLAQQALDHLAVEAAQATGAPHPLACVVRVHPSLLHAVQARVQSDAPEAAAHVHWRADANLAPLDCEVDTPGGRLLAGLETQLQRVQAALLNAQTQAQAQPQLDPQRRSEMRVQ